MPKTFLRRTWSRFSKLGKGRKKKQKWRNPTGRDNKMREKRKGRPATVSIGYGGENKVRPVLVKNIKELQKISKNDFVIIGNVGKKKKIEIAKKANEMKIKIHNLNAKNFLKEIEKQEKAKAKKKIKEMTKKEQSADRKEKKKTQEPKKNVEDVKPSEEKKEESKDKSVEEEK
ncbi:MAG: eL32 family ribosomal protein [archaeon]